MMRNKLLFGLGIVVITMISSCSSSDDQGITNCTTRLLDYSDKMSAAGLRYSQNPTTENCLNYRKAIDNYIHNTKDCPGSQTETVKVLLEKIECK
ncbi:hypothetical protein [Tenacibaculum finnmarkense]|uniref:hypothetical protein n=1 Tax=Tenacibaculum finnmarkense TaxID=2781243 RepID=UPI003BB6BE3C